MLILSKILRSGISSSVGDGKRSNPEDVVSVRKKLKYLGLDAGNAEHGMIDRKLDQAIRKFQKRQKLRAA